MTWTSTCGKCGKEILISYHCIGGIPSWYDRGVSFYQGKNGKTYVKYSKPTKKELEEYYKKNFCTCKGKKK